jgi:hypothetical protein
LLIKKEEEEKKSLLTTVFQKYWFKIRLFVNIIIPEQVNKNIRITVKNETKNLFIWSDLSVLKRERLKYLHSIHAGRLTKWSQLVPKFAGSNPGRSRRIFQGEKILSTPSFGGEVKPSVPCRRLTACKRSLNVTWKSGISGKIHRPFLAHIVPHLAARISGETTSGES